MAKTKKTQPKKPQFKFIVDPIYRMPYFYCDSHDINVYKKLYKELLGREEDIDLGVGGRFEGVWNDNFEAAIIWAPKGDPTILAHEVTHAAVWTLCERRQIPINENNDEVLAYYIQYLMKECLSEEVAKDILIRKDLNGKILASEKYRKEENNKREKVLLLRNADKKT